MPRPPLLARVRPAVRTGLGLMALAQLAIGLLSLLPAIGYDQLPGMHGHLGHETAVFNLAIAAALGWVAAKPARARGPVPLLSVFVLLMAALEALDLVGGSSDWARAISHLPAALGLLLIGVLLHTEPGSAPEPETAGALGEQDPAGASAELPERSSEHRAPSRRDPQPPAARRGAA